MVSKVVVMIYVRSMSHEELLQPHKIKFDCCYAISLAIYELFCLKYDNGFLFGASCL